MVGLHCNPTKNAAQQLMSAHEVVFITVTDTGAEGDNRQTKSEHMTEAEAEMDQNTGPLRTHKPTTSNTWSSALGLPKLGGLAVGPSGRPAASPGLTPFGRSSLDTLDPGRLKARSPTCMWPKGRLFLALSARSLGLGVLLSALLAAPLAASAACVCAQTLLSVQGLLFSQLHVSGPFEAKRQL